MLDLTALTAELHHERQLRMGAEKSNESLQRQVVEERELRAETEARLTAELAALKSAYAKDTGRLKDYGDKWKAIAWQHIADRTFLAEEDT